jgi:general secretion pathway protein A
MYLEHFGLEANPFSLTPDPRFLFLTPKHREALAGLLFAVTARKGFLVLIGEAGTGKTTLVKKLLQSIPATCAHFSVIVNPTLTAAEFLEYLLIDFGVTDIPSSKAARLFLLKKLLLKAYREGKTSVLVVDEAHLLTSDLIEEVRLLSNFETSEEKLLQVILAGQQELKLLLDVTAMRQLKQRIAVRLSLDPLERQDVKRYIESRWARAGGKEAMPFSESAIALIAESSRGTPRVINVMCDSALTNAFGVGGKRVGPEEIREVIADLHLPGDEQPATLRAAQPAPSARAAAPLVPDAAPLDFKSLQRYMPSERKTTKFFRWTNWFSSAPSMGTK